MFEKEYVQLNKVLNNQVKKDVLVKGFTRLNVGGPADLFYQAKIHKQFKQAKTIATMSGIKYHILKPESNILVADEGIRGLVIYQGEKIKYDKFVSGPLFKEVMVTSALLAALEKQDIETEKLAGKDKVGAGFFIQAVGLGGQLIGEAIISPDSANLIVNQGQATASDILILLSMIKQQVRDKFNIQLQEEIQLLI